ncbi:MAG: endolytic transglycosylase MltG, partial [Clostridia bacterium]|nr:endolytic transglycosylase MltG [Clostridia bacterium]
PEIQDAISNEVTQFFEVPVEEEPEVFEDEVIPQEETPVYYEEAIAPHYEEPEVQEEIILDAPAVAEEIPQEAPKAKGRPKPKKGYGLLGIPHILATFVWLAIILAIGVSLGRTLWLCCADVMAFDKPSKQASITITDSDDIESIANKLAKQGLIRYPGLFKTFAELTGKDENISVGTFTLDSKLDYNAMINGMTIYAGARYVVDVTFPEGYTCRDIFELLEEKEVCTVAELEEYAANGELDEYWFLEGVERGDKYCLEGYLFPDTYEFYTNDEPGRVLEKMLDCFDMRYTDIMKERLTEINTAFADMLSDEGYDQEYIDSHPITIREAVIIASLIEKESANVEENHVIASVIYNRLTDSSQPHYLNIDAALIYGLGGKIDPETGESLPLTTTDLQTENPYNTYLNTGLVPGPICNPGQESLNAALTPEETNYSYYALNPETGSHKFFKNYDDHLDFLEEVQEWYAEQERLRQEEEAAAATQETN